MNTIHPVDSPRLNQRRRAIYAAMRSLFGDRQAAMVSAFRLWEREFADRPHFVVTRYVARCAEILALSESERIAFTRRIFEFLAQPYESLPRYPESLLIPAAPSGMPAAPAPPAADPVRPPLAVVSARALPAAAIVAGAVGRALLAPVRAQARSRTGLVSEIVADAARLSKLPDDLRQRLLEWCGQVGGDDTLLADLSDEALRLCVHVLYLAACDAGGPVAADRLLAQAIDRAGALPAAVEFPADRLL